MIHHVTRSLRKARGTRGAVLLEVLLATGLLGVVTACLLTGFQQARKIEGELKETLGELEESNRVIELLQRDLLRARVILREDAGRPRGTSLTMLLEPTEPGTADAGGLSLVGYHWDPAESTLVRTVELHDGPPLSVCIGRRSPVGFEIVAERAPQSVDTGLAPQGFPPSAEDDLSHRPAARAVRVRILEGVHAELYSSLVGGDASADVVGLSGASREFVIPLPVAIPVVAPEESRP